MLSKLALLITFSGAAFGQTVVNGQNYIPCSASVVLNPSYLAEYLDLNCAVTSLTIPAGAAGKPYHLTIYQDGGSLTSIPAAISGDMSLNSTGYTSFRMVCADLVGTGTIPAATLAIAGCSAAVTIPVTGAIVGHRVDVMLASGALPATNVYLNGSVTSAGNVSAVQCATVGLGLTALPVRISVGP